MWSGPYKFYIIALSRHDGENWQCSKARESHEACNDLHLINDR